MVEFEFPILADLAKFSPEVGSVVDAVNANLSTFGVSDRMCVQSEVGTMTLTTEQEPTAKEMADMKQTIRQHLAEKCPDSVLTIGEPRRKSGKSSNQPTATE